MNLKHKFYKLRSLLQLRLGKFQRFCLVTKISENDFILSQEMHTEMIAERERTKVQNDVSEEGQVGN